MHNTHAQTHARPSLPVSQIPNPAALLLYGLSLHDSAAALHHVKVTRRKQLRLLYNQSMISLCLPGRVNQGMTTFLLCIDVCWRNGNNVISPEHVSKRSYSVGNTSYNLEQKHNIKSPEKSFKKSSSQNVDYWGNIVGIWNQTVQNPETFEIWTLWMFFFKWFGFAKYRAKALVPTIQKTDHCKSGHFCSDFKWFRTKWLFVQISNGLASGF